MTTQKPLAIVTGASRGIGAAIALRLAQDGYYVFVNYASNESKAQQVLDQIIHAGGSGELCGFDVSQPDQIDEKVDAIVQSKGPIHVLVNNAGITIDSLLIRLKNQDLERTLDIDLKGAIYCTRAVAKSMMRARQGSIVQISSVVGE